MKELVLATPLNEQDDGSNPTIVFVDEDGDIQLRTSVGGQRIYLSKKDIPKLIDWLHEARGEQLTIETLQDRVAELKTANHDVEDLRAENERLREALENVTKGMDRAGGDGYGMPECPWCHRDGGYEKPYEHNSDCTLVAAREALGGAK